MFNHLLSLLTSALTVCAAQAGNIISLSSTQGSPGDEVTVTMEMSGTDAVSAIDMRLPLPAELTYVEGSAQLTARCPSHQVSASTVDGTLRLMAYSLSLAEITGTAGEVLSFKLRLGNKPLTVALEPTVVLGNAEGTKLYSQTSAGEVQIRCAELTLDSPQIDFGHIPIRSTYTGWLTLRNSGNEPMTLISLTSDSPVINVSANGEVIGAGETRQYEVTFSPTTRGAFTSKIAIDCDAVNRFVYNRLHTAEVIADPFSVNELHVDHVEGTSGTKVTVSLRMNNMELISGMQVDFSLPEGIDYVEGSSKISTRATDHQIVGTLAERQLTLLAFSPTNSAFDDDDGVVATFDVELNALSDWYYLSPENVKLANSDAENMVSATYGEYVVIQSPTIVGVDSIDFEQQDVTAPLTASYRVENQGQAPLVIERVTFLADGYSVKTALPLTIEPKQSASLEIIYCTTTAGDFTSTMNIYSNDPEMRLKTVTISGTAYSPNSLRISGEYDKEEGIILNVALENDSQIMGVQFDLLVDNPAAVDENLSISATERLDGFVTVSSKIADGHFRLIAYVIGDKTISGNSGDIITLSLPNGTETPETVEIILDKMVLSSGTSQNMLSPEAKVSCVLTLNPTPASALILDKSELILLIGVSATIVATVSPEDTTDKTVTWKSSDETVATVNSEGVVTALAVGTATITATCGNVSATCEVTVKSDAGIENVSSDSFGIRVEGNELVIEGIAGDVPVRVFTLDGKLVYAGYERRIALQEASFYIVVYPGGSQKIAI